KVRGSRPAPHAAPVRNPPQPGKRARLVLQLLFVMVVVAPFLEELGPPLLK
ncbi:hypothetical protein ACJX0J_023427, partial [Zea mays]